MADSLTSFIIAIRGVLPSEDAKAAIVAQTGRGFQVKTENNGTRAIITPEYNAKDFSRKFAHEANGVVIDVSNARILAVPIRRYNPKPNPEFFKYSAERMAKYTIERVQDGTVLTLYHYKDEWQVSTVGGFSMGGVKWIGDTTYMEMINDINPGLFDRLDVNYSYTIGIHHPAIHPLARDPRRMWLYWACDLREANAELPNLVFSRPDIGLTNPESLTITIPEMIDTNKSTLARYLAGEQPEYGYILRGEFEDFGVNSNIYLESSLSVKIKQLFYNVTKRYSEHRKILPQNRIKYICCIAFFVDSVTFVQLFPQFQSYFSQITGIVDAVERHVVLAAGNKKKRQELPRIPKNGGRIAVTKTIANIVLNDIEGRDGKAQFQISAPGARGIVRDHIMRGLSIDYWCNALVPILE